VVFYILAALRTHLREINWFESRGLAEPRLADLLDLVALGTVADVVPLDRNNRILVEQGLKRIRLGRCIPGIRALLKVAGRPYQKATAGDFGFAVGPRLNAAGRLTDMTLGIECLLCDDEEKALEMAASLDALNKERREIQQQMQDSVVSDMPELGGADMPFGLCLYNDNWHQGVVGVLASRLKDQWQRPVIAFARDKDGLLKGSGRSIAAIHLRDLLDSIATGTPGLITKFGGHAMAAGLVINERDFDEFRSRFEAQCRTRISADDLRGVIHTDGELPAADINLSLAASIQEGGPWGNGFPEPVFDGLFQLSNRRIVADRHLKMTLALPGCPRKFDAVAFFTLDDDWPADVNHVQLAYRLDINEYNGRRTEQLIAEYVEPVCK
jgi:single-stranded-DNA-specific exonuclease